MGRPKKAAADSAPPAAKPGTRKRGRPPKRSGKKPKRRAGPSVTDPAESADRKKSGGDTVGGKGDVAVLDESRGIHNKAGDLRMIERAIRRRWGTRPEVMDALLSKAARLGLSSDDPRVLFGALRCHLQAEAQNQADELKQIPDQLTVSHVNAPLTADGQRTAILRAIAAEREKRVVRRGRKRVGPVNGPTGRESTG